MKLKNQTVLVSGGSGGIGSATIKALCDRGAKVYSIDVADAKSSALEGVTYLKADLANKAQLKAAISQIKNKVDVLFLNTGIMCRGTIFDSTEEDYDLLFNSNLKASWMLLKYMEPLLSEQACIVQMSSGHALHPEADPGLYTLTKMATAALAEILTITRPDFDVKTVYPGPVLTDLLLTDRSEEDINRLTNIAHKPEFVAEKIIELITSNEKSLQFKPKTWDYVLKS